MLTSPHSRRAIGQVALPPDMASSEGTEPFPSLLQTPGASSPPRSQASPSKSAHSNPDSAALRKRSHSNSSLSRRTRVSSLGKVFLDSNLPYGICHAAGEVASKAPTLAEIKKGSFCADGWTEEGQMVVRGATADQIQKRKASRASSLSASRHRGSSTSPLSAGVDERKQSFPTMHARVSNETNRVPFPIPETDRMELHNSSV